MARATRWSGTTARSRARRQPWGEVAALAKRAASLDARIAKLRDLLFGKAERADFDFAQGRVELEKAVTERSALQRGLHAEEAAAAQCRRWLENLASDAVLDQVEVAVPPGATLSKVRAQLKAAEAELASLRAAPPPSRDIKQRLKVYLYELARPKITGISAGEKLRIIWPGARETLSGPSEVSAETLPLFALLFRDQMLDSLLAEVERMSNTPLPAQQRAERMKVLEEEIDQLQRVEEVLVAREGAERSTNCAPTAVLGVRVADAHGVRAA